MEDKPLSVKRKREEGGLADLSTRTGCCGKSKCDKKKAEIGKIGETVLGLGRN